MSTSRNIHLELYQARLLYNTLPGYMMGGIKQILIDEYGYRNLGRNVLGLIVYNISEDTIYMNSDCDIEGNIIGRENQFMYATDEQKKLFYSKMSNLSNNI